MCEHTRSAVSRLRGRSDSVGFRVKGSVWRDEVEGVGFRVKGTVLLSVRFRVLGVGWGLV